MITTFDRGLIISLVIHQGNSKAKMILQSNVKLKYQCENQATNEQKNQFASAEAQTITPFDEA